MAAKSSENGMVSATMRAPRALPRKRNRMIDDQDHSLGQVVQNGVGGEMQQVASVDEGYDLYPFGQNLVVQLFHF